MKPSRELKLRFYKALNGHDYYSEFLETLDDVTEARIRVDVQKLRVGLGFLNSLGNKLWELKLDYGPGYRVYYTKQGNEIVLVLAGSMKRDQSRTIALASRLLKEIENEDKTRR